MQPGKPTYPMLEVPGQLDGAPAWSPNGRELAVATVSVTATGRFASSVIDLFVPSEGIVVNSLASSRTDALIVDGWWADGEGLLAWSDPGDAASTPADKLPLVSYPLGDEPIGDAGKHPGLSLVRGTGRVGRDAGDRRGPRAVERQDDHLLQRVRALRARAGRAAGPGEPRPGRLPVAGRARPRVRPLRNRAASRAGDRRHPAGPQRLVPDLSALVRGRGRR